LAATLGPGLTAFALLPLQANAASLGILVAGTADASGVCHLARWLPALEAFGAVGAALLAPSITERQHLDDLRAQVRRVIEGIAFRPVFQPILALDSGALYGYEALTRFDDGTRPDERFAEATAVGLGPELELACLRSALTAAATLPDGVAMTLNISPALLAPIEPLAELLGSASVPVVLEITEHVPIDDYPAVRAAIASLQPRVRFAVDDAGAGFASFRHIVDLEPDFVKLDLGLIRSIERDPARQAFVAGMVYFAARTDCELIAEGIETEGELACLRALGVGLGQGYLLGRPAALGAALAPSNATRMVGDRRGARTVAVFGR
jgi:EAL domain-containing protein (putative c-di-GMP-specific phosphodiesterase class I)